MQAKYKISLDPTVDEIKKLCTTCRKYAKSERVLFHYNGHGVPKPTANGEIWLFNKVYFLTQIAFSGLWVISAFSYLGVCFRVIRSIFLCQSATWIPG